MIDEINWSNLKTYKDDKCKSFEELCFLIASGKFGKLGHFTSIDDTGGGDGVEFYLTLPNGDEWGWQAKFFFPNPRLSDSNRKTQVKNSLLKACNQHPKLTKWFLCTPTNFTPVADKKSDKKRNSEIMWFDEELPKAIPEAMKAQLELTHWGESDFVLWIGQPEFQGIQNYFFGKLELNIDWFRSQSQKQMMSIKDKYNPLLHTATDVE